MILSIILGGLAALSLALALWQWAASRRFPLHARSPAHSFPPAVTLLKPLKGMEASTADCLRSWLEQDYTGRVQTLFGVADPKDPVCDLVRNLLKQFPSADATLITCGPPQSANAKVSTLVMLEQLASHDLLVISDADVRVPPDLLTQLVEGLRQPNTGLVNCFYELANPASAAMACEAVAINADFWGQVLQARMLKPLDFALGAVMALHRANLRKIGGFASLADCLADDYQLGHRIAASGSRIGLSPVVVQCWSDPMSWRAVWKHQLRWARTIRVCQPAPYFFSILSNATVWPLVWAIATFSPIAVGFAAFCLLLRLATAYDLQRRLTRRSLPFSQIGMPWIKDLMHLAVWACAFAGNRIEWRGQRMVLRKDGTLAPAPS